MVLPPFRGPRTLSPNLSLLLTYPSPPVRTCTPATPPSAVDRAVSAARVPYTCPDARVSTENSPLPILLVCATNGC